MGALPPVWCPGTPHKRSVLVYERWEDAECLDAAGAAAKDCEDEVGRILMENYEKCRYVKSVGALAVYVTSGCPRAMMIRGTLVSSKVRCRECHKYGGGNDGIRRKTGTSGKDTRDQEGR